MQSLSDVIILDLIICKIQSNRMAIARCVTRKQKPLDVSGFFIHLKLPGFPYLTLRMQEYFQLH